MKKFKLIKEYPGSPNLGTICEERNNKSSFCYYFEGEKNIGITKDQVEDQPEYWEEVIQKDYQILRYYSIENPSIGRTTCNSKLNDTYNIYSVKRLSDGEVFTVGDLITGYHEDARSIQTIKICTYTGRIRLEQSGGYTDLMHATKVKPPIFLTHDGKDIYEGYKVWCVNKHSQFIGIDGSFIATSTIHFDSDLIAYFLTREDAENYLEKKKVLFTTEDGVEVRKGDMIHGVYRTTNTISNTVVGCNRGVCDPFIAVFSTRAAAENYLIQKLHSLSIEDFWKFDSWGGSNIAKSKRLKRLVKERLNLK